MSKNDVCVRYFLSEDHQRYQEHIARGGTNESYMARKQRWYYLMLPIAPNSAIPVKKLTHEERRIQEFKLWKYAKALTRSKSFGDYVAKFYKFRRIVGEERIIVV